MNGDTVIFRVIVLVTAFCTLSVLAQTEMPLRVAVLSTDVQQMDAYSRWAARFEDMYPRISLDVDYFSDAHYKAHIEEWLEQGTYDVFYWQSGLRLESLVSRNLITPLSSLIDRRTIQRALPEAILGHVRYNGQIQALPFAQYGWGFYYNSTLFAELGLQPPATWEEFITLCRTLQENGVAPLIQANQEKWPTLAWFDYLSLLAGGLEARNALIAGLPSHSPTHQALSKKFTQLLENDFFFAPEHAWPWQQTIPALVRKQAAMTLMGQFAESVINPAMSESIGYFPFPLPEAVNVELSPTEVFVVANASNNKAAAGQFLAFLLEPWVQVKLAVELGWLPTNLTNLPDTGLTQRQRGSARQLQKKTQRVQYFDRDAMPSRADELAAGFLNAKITHKAAPVVAALSGTNAPLPEPSFSKPKDNRLHFASIKGHKTSFLASRILSKVYRGVGYDISVTRFPSTEAALKSYQQGTDGELVRIGAFANVTDELIQVPTPLLTVDLIMVSTKSYCADPGQLPQKGAVVGSSSDALVFRQWALNHGFTLHQFDDEHLKWEAFVQGTIEHIVTSGSGIADHKAATGLGCKRVVGTYDFYHYLADKHRKLVQSVDRSIVRYKKSSAYRADLAGFGL